MERKFFGMTYVPYLTAQPLRRLGGACQLRRSLAKMPKLLWIPFLSLICAVSGCSLDGLWYDPASTRSAQLLFRFTTLPDSGETVIAVTENRNWVTGVVQFDELSGTVHLALDNGEVQVGTLQSACNEILWSIPRGPVWVRIPSIKKVHIVFMNHLDVGYNGIPSTGYINNVLNTYFHEYFPRAIRLAEEMEASYPEYGFIYTTHPWLISLYLDCPPNLILSDILLQCPTTDEIADFEDAIKKGYIAWHAGPMNMQIEVMNEIVLQAGIRISADLDSKFSKKTTVLSQRDVPGLTAAAIPFLLAQGISSITVGVNPGSAPPAVPDLFLWDYNGHQIIAMWHPGGYPLNPGSSITAAGGLSLKDVVISNASSEVLAFAFRTDNSGPPTSVQEILTYYEILGGEFPGALVTASTFEDFVNTLDRSTLPVVSGEVGDTWIQGVGSDPLKMSQYRAASDALTQCFNDEKCSFDDPEVINATRFLVKLPEHTWGLPSVYDNVNWTNNMFETARKGRHYQDCQNSWLEQRLFLNLTLEACSGHPLHDYIMASLEQLIPQVPSLKDYYIVTPNESFSLFGGAVNVAFDSEGGWIYQLDYVISSRTHHLASKTNPLAFLTYHTYNESDFEYFNSLYDYYGNAGYDKPNSTINAHPKSAMYKSSLESLYRSMANPADFIAKFTFDPVTHSYYGSPSEVWMHYTFTSSKQAHVGLKVEVVMINKTATRLAEATMLSFQPMKPTNTSTWNGFVYKISNSTPIDMHSVVRNGSQLQHVAQQVLLNETSGELSLILLSQDTPLICPILSTTGSPTPFPAPLTPLGSNSIQGIAFNIHNNIWNTNYPLWYPFLPSDENIKLRFQLDFSIS